jgi:hypothetical protein
MPMNNGELAWRFAPSDNGYAPLPKIDSLPGRMMVVDAARDARPNKGETHEAKRQAVESR